MNDHRPLPDPDRLRRTPARFSWVDHRLLRNGHLAACPCTKALALYLILVAAADARGLSYYSDKRLSKLLDITGKELAQARRRLIDASLVAWRSPHYQVLSLDPDDIRRARLRQPSARSDRSCETMSLQQALQQIGTALNQSTDTDAKP